MRNIPCPKDLLYHLERCEIPSEYPLAIHI